MTQSDFIKCMQVLDDLCNDITTAKRSEYIESSPDVLANFYFIANEMNLSTYQVLYVYLRKHFSSIATFCRTNEANSEPIERRIADAINFLRLLYALIEDRKQFIAQNANP